MESNSRFTSERSGLTGWRWVVREGETVLAVLGPNDEVQARHGALRIVDALREAEKRERAPVVLLSHLLAFAESDVKAAEAAAIQHDKAMIAAAATDSDNGEAFKEAIAQAAERTREHAARAFGVLDACPHCPEVQPLTTRAVRALRTVIR